MVHQFTKKEKSKIRRVKDALERAENAQKKAEDANISLEKELEAF
jgi:hypothetical protein